MTPEQFAKEHGVDFYALRSLLDFIRIRLERATPDKIAVYQANPDEFLKMAVERWHEAGVAFYSKLMNGQDEESIAMRRAIAEEVWTTVRARQVASA